MNKNILVIGGGTAGWLTALFANKFHKGYNVILVESSDIGILGAGEGSTPFLPDFLRFIDLDILDVIKNSKGTFKNGIVFDNWNGDGKKYGHMFDTSGEMGNFALDGIFSAGCKSYFYHKAIASGKHLDDLLFSAKLTYQNKSPFIVLDSEELKVKNEIYFSLHFDARLLAEYLKKIALSRGVRLYDDKLKQINANEHGYITSIDFESGLTLDAKFVFDCTGLRREIIGKFYKSEWKDYSKNLPCDSAIPFFPDMDDEIPPYTLSKAMKYGWMWKIPLQHRYGAGYVFDSKQISPENAKKELDDLMGYEVYSPKTFKFNPGAFKQLWVKNCMAIGLASGFIEPLEATAIWVACAQLDHSLRYFILTEDQDSLDYSRIKYNTTMANSNDKVLDFIYLHYITKRKDTAFWRDFMKINQPTEGVLKLLEEIKHGPLDIISIERMNNINHHIMKWTEGSYLEICNGLELLNKKFSKTYSDNYTTTPNLEDYTKKTDSMIQRMLGHKEALQRLNIYNP